MLSHAGLGNMYWAEAVATATYLRNRMVSTALKIGETPYLLWYGRSYLLWYGEKPNLKHIRVFGCVVYTHIPDRNRKKLGKAQKLRFIGYTTQHLPITKFGTKKNTSAMFVMMLSSIKKILVRTQILMNYSWRI